ncbi:hypothetical protein E2C01_060539 [Portunus trituberculatus]|uniref:Uncharacterized protein n=1 Tax=Portunus trituberculatus TaxID=210409 RepID=A0A5B7H5R3_PORTR|nr:hypothetical protein [Portunus trituberculatus]
MAFSIKSVASCGLGHLATLSQSREGAQGTSAIARHTMLSTHLHCLRPSPDPVLGVGLPLRPWNISCFNAHASTQHTALRSQLSALAITTLDLPTLLVASGVHPSWQHAVLRLTCAFLTKAG